MPQETNLNVSPYYDDFDINNDYYKVLFKPGYPVQARELTTLQTILQNQIEQFGNHTFKEGSVVIPGNVTYRNDLNAVIVEDSYQGLPSNYYFESLLNIRIKGQVSGITAIVENYLEAGDGVEKNTLYVRYLTSSGQNNQQSKFFDGENLLLDEDVEAADPETLLGPEEEDPTTIILAAGEGFATTLSQDSTAIGSAVYMDEGIYFIRGSFVKVPSNLLYLDPYSNIPSYRVGLRIFEEIINSFENEDLNDNAQGFSNYAAPGADRFSIEANLEKIDLNSTDTDNFVELMQIVNGKLNNITSTPEYNILSQEFARRTYDESGNYYVSPPIIEARETLNDLLGNDGIFNENQLTYNNNVPNENLGTYSISPFKAYVRGYEIDSISPKFLDFDKPRETKTLEDQSLNYFTGPSLTLNRVYGSPVVGIATTYFLSLRDSRVGTSQTTAAGNEIGLARVYDFALESGSYTTSNPDENQWDISLYDVQTYTTLVLNEPITLSTPTHIKGKESGAVGFLRYDVSASDTLTVYDINGKFSLGEKLIFDGIENTRVTKTVRSYGINDVKSLYGIVGTAYTFTADTIQSPSISLGEVNITAESAGVSTVTSPDIIFVGVATVGNLVAFSNPGFTTNTFAKIESVSESSLTIAGITTVTGICDGGLPITEINPSNFAILSTQLQSSTDNTLYTPLPKENISSVDLTESNLTIRKQFDVTVSSNSTGAVTALTDETFLPFDEERYVLIMENGTVESLSPDKFSFTNGSQTLTINGLSTNGNGKLIATLRKINVKSKIKNRNRVKIIIVDKSKYSASGVGATTLNDGLTYGNYPYGTRVQDQEICLLESDITRVYGVYESNDTNTPDLPSLVLVNMDGPTNKTGDLLLGEEFVGETSKSVGVFSEKINDLKIGFVYLNSNTFIQGEKITFKESGITAFISVLDVGDKNISSIYNLDTNQKDTFYDYSKLVRIANAKEPSRKLKVVYEYGSFSSSDTGDLTTANSYEQFDYCDIGDIDGIKNTDILDVRPRVSSTTPIENSRSPFEFLSRNFTAAGNSASNVLASDESILLSYSIYLPRIDKIFLNKNGSLQLRKGVSAEIPQPPISTDDSLEVATAFLPPYLCDISNMDIQLREYKRYRMSDISLLETRIENLEYYTSLSLLEKDASNLSIVDENGLNRFKSGIFVDNFSTTISQEKVTIVKNSIDTEKLELRPTHYTTSIDLLLGTNTIAGIGNSADPLADLKEDDSLIGTGVKRTGQLITLDYEEVEMINQPYSSRSVNVSPYAEDFFGGTIQLFPSSDVWIDQVRMSPKTVEIENAYIESEGQIIAGQTDPQVGANPVTWNSHESSWTGKILKDTNSNKLVFRKPQVINGNRKRQKQVSRIPKPKNNLKNRKKIINSPNYVSKTFKRRNSRRTRWLV